MLRLTLLIVFLATTCGLALAVRLLAVGPAQQDPGNVMLVRGDPLEIQCGKNHGKDCLGLASWAGTYKGKKDFVRITNVTIRNIANPGQVYFSSDFDPLDPPQVEITYMAKQQRPARSSAGGGEQGERGHNNHHGRESEQGGDIIIIKGDSLEIQCGKNHGYDCLGKPDLKTGTYQARRRDAHFTHVTVRNVDDPRKVFYDAAVDPLNPVQIEITYVSPPTPTPIKVPSPTPSPILVPTAPVLTLPVAMSSDHDTDKFKTFDALPRAAQEETLIVRGPRLPEEYKISGLSTRVFVAAGWPAVIDYELTSDAPAALSIAVEGAEPLKVSLKPGKRTQLDIPIPAEFGAEPRVGKLRIKTSDTPGRPAKFQLYGIAMGDRGVQALKRLAFGSGEQLAQNRPRLERNSDYESNHISSVKSAQTGSTLLITVDPPTTINASKKPPIGIHFSLESRSDFSNGRWEVWLVRGLDWKQVWKQPTGSISARRKKSQTWNGMLSNQTISLGDHALQLAAWHGRESDRSWVIARAASTLVVIQ